MNAQRAETYLLKFLLTPDYRTRASVLSLAQSSVTLYYDSEQQIPKETFQVAETDPSVLEGAYTAYFTDGSVKTKGQYVDNQATGFWEYFYENGHPKMRGTLEDNQNAGPVGVLFRERTLANGRYRIRQHAPGTVAVLLRKRTDQTRGHI